MSEIDFSGLQRPDGLGVIPRRLVFRSDWGDVDAPDDLNEEFSQMVLRTDGALDLRFAAAKDLAARLQVAFEVAANDLRRQCETGRQ